MPINQKQLKEELRNIDNRIDYGLLYSENDRVRKSVQSAKFSILGKTLSEQRGGFKALEVKIDDPSNDQDLIPDFVLSQMTEDVPGVKEKIKTDLNATRSAALAKIINASTVTPSTKAAARPEEIGTQMNHMMITDASPDAVAIAIKKAANITNSDEFKEALENLTSPELASEVSEAVDKLDLGEISSGITNLFSSLDKQLIIAAGGLNSGNLLKDVIENVGSGIENLLSGFGSFVNKLSTSIKNDLLSGNIKDGIDKTVSGVTIDPGLLITASEFQIAAPKNLEEMTGFLQKLDARAPAATALTEVLRTQVAKVETAFERQKLDVANTVKPDTAFRPIMPTTNIEELTKANTFLQLNSREAIISVLNSATRDISAVVWHWTGHFNDQGEIGARQIDTEYKAKNLPGVPYHFVIKKNGTIEVGATIHEESPHTYEEFRQRSIGIAFVAGFNGVSGGPPGTAPLDQKSITRSQWASFKLFMNSFYTCFPGGEAFGNNVLDLDQNAATNITGPGFDVEDIIMKPPYSKINITIPERDRKFLDDDLRILQTRKDTNNTSELDGYGIQ